MIAAALAFFAGLVLVQQFSVLPARLWWLVLAVLAVIMAIQGHRRWLLFLTGMIWALLCADYRCSQRLAPALEGKELTVSGYITDVPETDAHKSRFDFVPTAAQVPLPAKLRLNWYQPDVAVQAGQQWTFTVKLKRPHGTLNLGSFDYERWLLTENVGATGYVRDYPKAVLTGQASLWQSIAVWRQAVVARLDTLLQHQAQQALIKALTVGDGSGISPQQWAVFRNTGTTHLVVISGSHVGLVAGLVYFLVLKLWARTVLLRVSPPSVAAIFAMLSGVGYAALAGFSIPTQRAVLMLAIVLLATLWQRQLRPFHTLAIALLAVLVADPWAVLSVGFYLSFLAVAFIVYALSGRLQKANYWIASLQMNIATSLGLAPLLLYFFQQVSLLSPVANFIAVPVISVVLVPVALLALLLMWLAPALSGLLFAGVDWGLQALWWLLLKLSALPWATVNHAQPSLWTMALAVLGVLWVLAPRGLPARWLGGVLCVPLVFAPTPTPQPGALELTLLDVGQGLAVVVQTAQHSLVFDTGVRYSEQSDSGQTVILPFLRHQGISQVDMLMVSHGDNDHIGGAQSLLQGMAIHQVLTSVPQQLAAFAPKRCAAGQGWEWDGVQFTVLSPQQAFASDNDNSCVLKIASLHGTVLLTGDIEATAEAWLLKTYPQQLSADILVAPHHGSKSSSTWAFLQAVQPKWALIPSGYRNSFGHPHPDVLRRYAQLHARWLTSADNGAITVSLQEGGWQVQPLRTLEHRYWQAD